MTTETKGSAFTRRTLVKGAAWSVPVVAVATATPFASASPLCTETSLFNTTAAAKFLGGNLLSTDLDNVAQLYGVTATETAGGATEVTNSNNLDVSALNTIFLGLSGTAGLVSSLLTFLTDTEAGLVAQFSRANEAGPSYPDANAIGASGAVTSTGAIALSANDDAPDLARVSLGELLAQIGGAPLSTLITGVTDLELIIGAVAGRASADIDCVEADTVESILREYLVAHLRLVVDSPVVGTIASTLGGLTIDTSLLATAINPILAALNALQVTIAGLTVGIVAGPATTTVIVDTSPILGSPFPSSPNEPVRLDWGNGAVIVDLGSLLGPAFGSISNNLNNLPPNTLLLADASLPTGQLGGALNTLIQELVDRLKDTITINISIPLQASAGIVTLDASVTISGTLRQFLENGGQNATVTVGGSGVIAAVVNPIINTTLKPLLPAVGQLVLDQVETLLGNSTTIFDPLNNLISALFTYLAPVLSITLNEQNAPVGNVSGALGGFYSVAALHIALLNDLDALDLVLASGSVGANSIRTP